MIESSILSDKRGFTLIEVIITIIVAAVLGVMLVSYTGTAVQRSAEPVTNAMDSQAASSCLDCIVQYYRGKFYGDGGPLYNVSDILTQINSNAFANCCGTLTIDTGWLRYNAGTQSLETGTSNDMLQVNVVGASGVTYSMLFSSKQ